MKLLKKIAKRGIWWFERHRSYDKILRQALELPPLETATENKTVFAVITTPQGFYNGIFTAWSWLRFFPEKPKLRIFVNGEVSTQVRNGIGKVLPQAEVICLPQYLGELQLGSALKRFVETNVMGYKAAVVWGETLAHRSSGEDGQLIYCDDDVLAFNQPHEVLRAVNTGGPPLYFQDSTNAYHEEMCRRLAALELPLPERFNAGFLFLPHMAFSLELAEKLVQDWSPALVHPHCEQTLQGGLMFAAGAKVLPPEKYVISSKRIFFDMPDEDYGNITARHFVSGVRHVMYLKGIPALLRHHNGENEKTGERQ